MIKEPHRLLQGAKSSCLAWGNVKYPSSHENTKRRHSQCKKHPTNSWSVDDYAQEDVQESSEERTRLQASKAAAIQTSQYCLFKEVRSSPSVYGGQKLENARPVFLSHDPTFSQMSRAASGLHTLGCELLISYGLKDLPHSNQQRVWLQEIPRRY